MNKSQELLQLIEAVEVDGKPTTSMVSNAKRGLELRKKWGRGSTAVGVARARDLSNRKNLSNRTILRMHSYFSRHDGEGTNKDNGGGPSAGAIAWLLWGGDSGRNWARARRNTIKGE